MSTEPDEAFYDFQGGQSTATWKHDDNQRKHSALAGTSDVQMFVWEAKELFSRPKFKSFQSHLQFDIKYECFTMCKFSIKLHTYPRVLCEDFHRNNTLPSPLPLLS